MLAAGQGFQLDGFNKILLKDPRTGKTILDNYLEYFPECDVTVVVGYKAITVMNQYPNLNYIYNTDWRVKSNSYSLALALSEDPCIILPSDFFFDEIFAQSIIDAPKNFGLVADTENRSLQALHCASVDNKIVKVYKGESEGNDPELTGIFKITDKNILLNWKRNCLSHGTESAFVGENLPFKDFEIQAIESRADQFHEINTPVDYLEYIRVRGRLNA